MVTLVRCGNESNGIANTDIPAVSSSGFSRAILIRLCVSIVVEFFFPEVGYKVGVFIDGKGVWIIPGNWHRVLHPTIKVIILTGPSIQRTGVTEVEGSRTGDGTASGWFRCSGNGEFCYRSFCDAVGRPLFQCSCCIKFFYNILVIAIFEANPCCVDGRRSRNVLGDQHSIVGCWAASLGAGGAIDVVIVLKRFRVLDTIKFHVIYKEGVTCRIHGTILCIRPGEGMRTRGYIKGIGIP